MRAMVLLILLGMASPGVAQEAVSDSDSDARWVRTKPRPFLAGRIDAGIAFARSRLSLGWGFPFDRWVGIQGEPIVSAGSVGAYGGARFQLPWVNLRAGVRYVHALQRSFFEPQQEIDDIDFKLREQGARYYVWEIALTLDLPAGAGNLIGRFTYANVQGVPNDRFVFEERIRLIIDPPHAWIARGGYAIRLKRLPALRIAPAIELVGNPSRNLAALRVGILARLRLWDSLEVRLDFLPPIKSRDDIGIVGGSFGLGVRYRWARVW